MLGVARRYSSFFYAAIRRYATAVHYITDTEGHAPSFMDSIARSNVVRFDRNGRLVFRKTAADPFFIFGGDLTDRGKGDTHLTEMLLDFKRRHPEQVKLLIGNREASKTRIYTELEPKYIRERLIRGGVPHWLQARPHQIPLDYVKKHMSAQGKSIERLEDIEEFVKLMPTEDCQLIYLKWMFEQNMGCPHTLKYYAQQLADKYQCGIHDISEHAVLKHVLEQNSPRGLMGEYLQQTQIAVIIPNTGILAVHGGLTAANMGRLPAMFRTDPRINDARLWIDQFNQWYRIQVQRWAESKPAELPLQLQPARSTLDSFAERIPADYMSIVTASILDEQRQFKEVPNEVSDYLRQNGIYLVLTGHQPCGDHPAIVRSTDDRVVYIMGDTSYANAKANDVHDTRGKASHTLQIFADCQNADIEIDAQVLAENRVSTRLTIAQKRLLTDSYVGKLLPGNELVQCRLSNGDYRTIHQNRFAVQYTVRSASEIEALLASSYSMHKYIDLA